MWKKIVTIVVTLALLVTNFNYVPSTAEASQTDASNYDWSTVEYLRAGGDTAEYANKYKMVVVDGKATIDIIQNPAWTEKPGVYTTFSDAIFGSITINDVETTDFTRQGAGIIFHMSAFSERVSDLVVRDGNGDVKAQFYVLNESEGSSETESNQPEVETKEPETIDSQNPGTSNLAVPTDVEAYNFYAQAKGYQFIFEEVAGAVSYNIYVDDVPGAIANIAASDEYVEASKFEVFANNKLHTVYVAAVDSAGNVSAKSEGAKVRITNKTNSDSDPVDISRVYVVTNSDKKITKESKTDASLTIISSDGEINTVSQLGTIKLRGNSTSLADKPAYNISFDKKQQVFKNAEKGKKWSLLANAYEKTLMRNKLGMDFGRALGNVAAPEEHYCDLYIDGKYMGNFIISEPADNERSGIEYDDSEESPDIMFEYEADRVEAEPIYYRTTRLGMRFLTEDLEDYIEDGSYKTMSKYTQWITTLNNFETALVNTSSTDVFNYIDVESFVDMYIANELFNTADFGYSSVKFYITYDENNNPTIHAGALWDFDLSSGNYAAEDVRRYDRFRCQEINTWFRYLMQNKAFSDMVKKKYEQMQPVIQNIYKDNKLGKSQINQIYEKIKASRIRNYSSVAVGGAGWSESEPDSAEWNIFRYSYSTIEPYRYYTYDQHVEYLRTWLKNRNEWICAQWGINMDVDSEVPEPTTPEPTTPVPTTPEPTTPVPTTPEPTTPVATTPAPTTPVATTPSVVDPTTLTPTTVVDPTTATPTTVAPTTTKKATVKPPKKTSVKSASKKRASNKVKVSIKNVKGANGYRVQFSTTKKFKKVLVTKNVKKATITITSKALKNKKKLYVRVKAYKLDGKKKVLAKKWSTAKAVKVK